MNDLPSLRRTIRYCWREYHWLSLPLIWMLFLGWSTVTRQVARIMEEDDIDAHLAGLVYGEFPRGYDD